MGASKALMRELCRISEPFRHCLFMQLRVLASTKCRKNTSMTSACVSNPPRHQQASAQVLQALKGLKNFFMIASLLWCFTIEDSPAR